MQLNYVLLIFHNVIVADFDFALTTIRPILTGIIKEVLTFAIAVIGNCFSLSFTKKLNSHTHTQTKSTVLIQLETNQDFFALQSQIENQAVFIVTLIFTSFLLTSVLNRTQIDKWF